jgi:hypothetical protein
MRTEHRPVLPGSATVVAGDTATTVAAGRRTTGGAYAQGLALAWTPRQAVRRDHSIDAGHAGESTRIPPEFRTEAGVGIPPCPYRRLNRPGERRRLGYAVAACEGKGTGEQTLLRGLLPLIVEGDILLADALLATWWIIAEIQRRGGDVVMVQQGRRMTDFAQGRCLGQNDHVVEWSRPQRPKWMSLDDYGACPPMLRMREVEVSGRVLVTTLLDPKSVSARELDTLYALRWNIEVDWRTIKVTMAMDVLRCRSPEMIEKEIAVHLLAYNLVRWAMATAARLGEVLPRSLSFTGAKRVLLAFGEQLRRCGGQRLSFMFATVLATIAGLTIPHRPGRIEPRAKKRRPKPLPFLTVPRHVARKKIFDQHVARGLIVVP